MSELARRGFRQAMYWKLVHFGWCLLACFTVIGCSDDRPENLPDLYPCTVKVMKGDRVLSNAIVSFSPEQGEWFANGQTTEDGVAVMKTLMKYQGVPAGVYRVGIAKNEATEGPSDDEIARLDYEEGAAAMAERSRGVSLVPHHLTVAGKSPILVEVSTDSENQIVVDVTKYPEPSN